MKNVINTLMLIILLCVPLIERSFAKIHNAKFKFKKLVHNLLQLHLESKSPPELLMKVLNDMRKDLFKMNQESKQFHNNYKELCEKDAASLKSQFFSVKGKIESLKAENNRIQSVIVNLEQNKIPEVQKMITKEREDLSSVEKRLKSTGKAVAQRRIELEEKLKTIREIVFILSNSNLLDPFTNSLGFIELTNKVKNPLEKLMTLLQLEENDSQLYKMLNLVVQDTILLNKNPHNLKADHIKKIISILFQLKKIFKSNLKDLRRSVKITKQELIKKKSVIGENLKSLAENLDLFNNTLHLRKETKIENEGSLLEMAKFVNEYEKNALERSQECEQQDREFLRLTESISVQQLYLKKLIGKFIDYSPEEIKKVLKHK